ncbi:hypothetical protein TIFTF001_024917 [Ficus carica]|uniref:Disease resistance R13L4/SHOC-2-like LRR domain-containing protein n=1 Tax=Ficus carica TaxID=3494 RepID=A0AA88DKG5_FICCA|nr:hypothetical protein TIFTF001_024917 [Ficus carica]
MIWYQLPVARYVPDRFPDLKRLRTLSLSGKVIELPSNIGELTHLRYLSLSDIHKDVILPPAIGNLFNLQTLRVLRCRMAELPEEVGKLINLRHLNASDTSMSWPRGVGRLRNLQTLKWITVSPANEEFQLRDLRDMNNLRDIYVEQLGIEEHVQEATQAQLYQKTNLVSLSMIFESANRKMEIHSKISPIFNVSHIFDYFPTVDAPAVLEHSGSNSLQDGALMQEHRVLLNAHSLLMLPTRHKVVLPLLARCVIRM